MKPLAIHCRQFSLSDLFRRWLIKENVTGKPEKKNKQTFGNEKKKTKACGVSLGGKTYQMKLLNVFTQEQFTKN